jgi:hypothetical protein
VRSTGVGQVGCKAWAGGLQGAGQMGSRGAAMIGRFASCLLLVPIIRVTRLPRGLRLGELVRHGPTLAFP